MADRGVVYMVWGESARVEQALERSQRSVAAVHPELPIEVIRVEANDPYEGLLEKSRIFARSPFRETLFLDADTVVLDRLDFGFRQAQRIGLACCICENPWARRYPSVEEGDLIEYNTGVLFFAEKAKAVFEKWGELARQVDSKLLHIWNGKQGYMPHNDQCSFALAIDQIGFSPCVLPLNWNFRPVLQRSFFGPIKVWHDYQEVPKFFYELVEHYRDRNAIIEYHAAKI